MSFSMTFVSVSDGGLRYLAEVVEGFIAGEEFGHLFEGKIKIEMYFVGEHKDHSESFSAIERSILSSDIVLLDLMGADRSVSDRIDKIIEGYGRNVVLLGYGSEYLRSRVCLGSFSVSKMMKIMELMRNKGNKQDEASFDMEKMLDRMGTLGKIAPFGLLKDMRNWVLLGKFWRNAGPENIKNMILLLCRDYGKIKELPRPGKPIDFSRHVLFDPENLRGFETLSELKKEWGWNKNLKTVGLLFHNFNYPNYSFGILSKIIKHLRRKYNFVPFGISFGSDKYEKISRILDEGLKLDLMWNFLPFRFGAGPMGGDVESGLKIFRRLNVPIMHPFFLGKRKITDWDKSFKGLSPMEIIVHIMLPELDGVVEVVPIAALCGKQNNRIADLQELRLIEHRFEKLTARSESYITLRNKNNKDKRIAFVLYNYPPGEGNVGGGSFLDTFKSIELISSRMKDTGYRCDQISASDLEETFMNNGVCNSAQWSNREAVKPRYSLEKYVTDTGSNLHKLMINRISKDWGNPPGRIMSDDESFLIPGIIDGNIFVGLQPSRGSFEDPSKLYHDKELPPHHQYLAFYLWLEREFKADVVIHVGTHGTLEFLPGKESALSDKCFPDYLIGKMTHLYLYYSGNPSEATIAKRRTYAGLISYSGPPFRRSGSYGDYVELENMINEYIEAGQLLPQKQTDLMKKIKNKVAQMKLLIDGDFTIDNISRELIRLKGSLVPVGLHEFGKDFSTKEEVCFLSAILSWNRGDICSIKEIIESAYDDLKLPNLKKVASTKSLVREGQISDLVDALVENYFLGDKTLYKTLHEQLSRSNRGKISATMKYGEECLERLKSTNEIGGLLSGLNGNYIEARLGGDLIRDPEVFPTGYNIYQFDPRLVPSEVAFERGSEIANSTLDYYIKEHKNYPETVSVVLWGLETSKTKGETIGQILSYLGVKIKRGNDVWETKFEIIPLSELKRPRVDCLITICGFFRDMFPNLIDLLDEIYDAVASLNEPVEMNFVRKHSLSIYKEMIKETDESVARELSMARIFGPAEGEYGTGITTMIESKNWNEEVEITDAYLSAQKHVYTRTRRGEAQRNLFEHNLSKVDLVSQ
ncbi:MAG: cobaltochelatase subunit CobN, partial [Syntrophobacterales bacterium]|nr:cobaltochelatase subunit CobN [Syntrophobacterales bacterium]